MATLNRSIKGVQWRRQELKKLPFGKKQRQPWTGKEDAALGTMPDKNLARVVEFFRRALGHESHLVLGHFPMRFVFDARDLATIFRGSNRAPENDDRSGLWIVIWRG